MIDCTFGTIGRRHGIKVKGILDAGLASYVESLAVGAPEGGAKVLVLVLVKIGPHKGGVFNGHKADAHVRVLLPGLGVMGAAEGAVLAEGRVDGEHGHVGIVKTVEGQGLAVRGPPEGTVAGRAAEDFLVINPAGVAVHHGFTAVPGEAGFLAGGDIGNPEVVGAGEGQLGGVRAVGEIHRLFRLQGEIGKLFRELQALGLCPLFAFYADGICIIECAVIGKCNLVVAHPLEISGHLGLK